MGRGLRAAKQFLIDLSNTASVYRDAAAAARMHGRDGWMNARFINKRLSNASCATRYNPESIDDEMFQLRLLPRRLSPFLLLFLLLIIFIISILIAN